MLFVALRCRAMAHPAPGVWRQYIRIFVTAFLSGMWLALSGMWHALSAINAAALSTYTHTAEAEYMVDMLYIVVCF